MLRSTKIVATLGPASSDPAVLERMVRAGVDVARLNFSHGTAADHEKRQKFPAEEGGRSLALRFEPTDDPAEENRQHAEAQRPENHLPILVWIDGIEEAVLPDGHECPPTPP